MVIPTQAGEPYEIERAYIGQALSLLWEERDLIELPTPTARVSSTLRVNERAVAARLFLHLNNLLADHYPHAAHDGLSVDSEYARIGQGDGAKEIPVRHGYPERTKFIPDIIVHRRRSRDHNILAIEVKPGTTRAAFSRADLHKIEFLVSADAALEIGVYRAGVALKIAANHASGSWRGSADTVVTTWARGGNHLGAIVPG